MDTISKAEMEMVMRAGSVGRHAKAVVLAACGLLRQDTRVDVLFHAGVLVDLYTGSPPWRPVDKIIARAAAKLVP